MGEEARDDAGAGQLGEHGGAERQDEHEASVQVFYVRRGRVVGRKGFVIDKVEDLDRPELIARILELLFTEPSLELPREVLVPVEP